MLAIFLWFGWRFYHVMLVVNILKFKDLGLTNIYLIRLVIICIRFECFYTNYVKCSNNFAADCICLASVHISQLFSVCCILLCMFLLSKNFVSNVVSQIRFLVPNKWKFCRKPLGVVLYQNLEYASDTKILKLFV